MGGLLKPRARSPIPLEKKSSLPALLTRRTPLKGQSHSASREGLVAGSKTFFLQVALQIKELELELAEAKQAQESDSWESSFHNRRSRELERQLASVRQMLATAKNAE